MSSNTTVDLAIIGAGPGGYTAALRASQLDIDVALIERDVLGGTCLSVGCIPSKALINTANTVHDIKSAEERGIHASVNIDFEKIISWKDQVVTQLTQGVEQLCNHNNVAVYDGTATFADRNRINIRGDTDASVEFDRSIIATGSRPISLPGFEFDGEYILDSSDVLSLSTLPKDLVIIGGGYIGMELAVALSKLGTEVTVVEMLDEILPLYDAKLTSPVKRRATQLGINLECGQQAKRWESTEGGVEVITEAENGDESTHSAEKLLVAIGRAPVTNTLDLKTIGLETNENGILPVNKHMQTELDNIYAIGDVTGEPMLAHKASAEGIVAAEHAAGKPTSFSQTVIPSAVFTDPEIATVGYTEDAAEDAGFISTTGEFPFTASGRALTSGTTDGFVRIVADQESKLLLGAQIVGPHASELIAELTLAIEHGMTLDEVERTIHIHPTLTESIMEAAAQAMGRAIHTT